MADDATYMMRPIQIRQPTLLYGITPKGLGGAEVESLYSLLLRLAYAHALPPSKLVNVTLAGDPAVSTCLSPEGRQQEVARMLADYGWGWGWGWDKHAGKSLIGTGPGAASWAKALEVATGIDGLQGCTLRALSDHVTDTGLVTDEERVCLECLKEDIQRGGLPYERLMWRMANVKCCVRHRRPLVPAKCGRPASEAQDPYLRVKHPGVCSGCGSIGYRCISGAPRRILPAELWRAQQCANLVEYMANLGSSNILGMKIAITQRYKYKDGGVSALAERSGTCKSALSSWINGHSKRTSLGLLLDIAAAESTSVVSILKGKWEPVPTPEEVKAPQRVPKSTHAVPHDTMRTVMITAVREGRTASEVARQLGVDLSTLAQHEELYAQLRKGTVDRQKQEDKDRRNAAVEEARQVAVQLKALGKTISLRHACELTRTKWYPSQLRAQALMVIRHTLNTGAPPRYAKIGSQTIAAAGEVVDQLKQEEQRMVN